MELAHQHPLFGLFQGGFFYCLFVSFSIWKANFDAACKLHFSLQCVPRGGIWRLILHSCPGGAVAKISTGAAQAQGMLQGLYS